MIESHLKRHFGFDSFKPGQKKVIELILRGASAGAIFPTGAGKSLCYQLPDLLHDFFSACEPYCASRDAAKFLCGIQTPFFSRKKIKQLPNFGILKRYPFQKVKDDVERQKDVR